MTKTRLIALSLAFATSTFWTGSPLAQEGATAESGEQNLRTAVEEAIEKGNPKLSEEVDRVPGLTYDDIARIAGGIPGKVQIPDPTSEDFTSRAVSVPGGLVSDECRHFARGFLAKRLATQNANLSPDAAFGKVIDHLRQARFAYARAAGEDGLTRSQVAAHDADCPICGPLNAAEIACHKAAVKRSPIRSLVLFDYASDVLRGGYFATIEQVKTLLDADPRLQVALIGRASLPGGPVTNFALSAARITSVWNGLTKVGIPIDRIVAIPIGEDEPHIDLQLAIEYGLEPEFAAYGQQPLNQSVYIVVFRPGSDTELAAFSAAEPAAPEEKQKPAVAEIALNVTEAGGSALASATVTATEAGGGKSRWILTGNDGTGFLRGLAPGDWTLTFEHKDFATATREIRLDEGATVNLAAALAGPAPQREEVRQIGGIDLSVTDSGGGGLPGVTVTATEAGTGRSRWIVTGDDGTGFLRGLEAGDWALSYEHEDFATLAREVRVDGGATLTEVAALVTGDAEPEEMPASGGIELSVTDASGAALPGATVTATEVGTGKSRWIVTSDDGLGFLRALGAGSWTLAVEREGYAALTREVQVDAGEARPETVSLAAVSTEGGGQTQPSVAKGEKIMEILGGTADADQQSQSLAAKRERVMQVLTGTADADQPSQSLAAKRERLMQILTGKADISSAQN